MFSEAQINNIPDALKVADQWLVWRRQKPISFGSPQGTEKPKEQAKIKLTKVPYDAKPNLTWWKADSTNPSSWSNFEQAVKCFHANSCTSEKLRQDAEAEASRFYLDGIGRVLTLNDGLVAWDFDHCLNPETGEITPDVLKKVNALDSYTEVSPSGDGLRVFTRGTLPWKANKKGNYEAYATERYVTVTGNHREGTPPTVEERQEAISQVHGDIFGPEPDKKATGKAVRQDTPAIGDDAALLDIARAAKNGDKFKRLFDEGDLRDFGGDESVADMSLVSYLSFYSGPDPERIDRLFRASALMRDKWDSKRGDSTWGRETIERVLEGRTEFYTPPASGSVDYGETNMSDLGNARRLMEAFGDDLHYVPLWKSWVRYDGTRWGTDQTGAVRRKAHETIGLIFGEAALLEGEERKKLLSFALASESEARINAMVNEARWLEGVAIMPPVLDCDPFLLNVRNGTLDLQTVTLRPHDRKDMLTKMAPVMYDSEARCPLWLAFLKSVLPNPEMRRFIKRAVGMSLTGDVREQCFFFLYGNGKNGKSTFTEIIGALLGDYWGKTKASTLMHKGKSEGGANNDVADLFGKRFISVSEIGEGQRLDEALIKDLAGDDAITARHLYQENVTFATTFKVWMYGNHKPSIQGTDNGIWRRVKLVPFTVQITEEECDPDIKAKLRAELPGILNWALRGCAEWLADGLGEPEEVTAATKEYREEMDALGTFIEDCCTKEPSLVGATKLYTKYREWCEDTGEYAKNQRKFGQALGERGFTKEKTRAGYMYLGLSLIPELPDYET